MSFQRWTDVIGELLVASKLNTRLSKFGLESIWAVDVVRGAHPATESFWHCMGCSRAHLAMPVSKNNNKWSKAMLGLTLPLFSSAGMRSQLFTCGSTQQGTESWVERDKWEEKGGKISLDVMWNCLMSLFPSVCRFPRSHFPTSAWGLCCVSHLLRLQNR